MMEGFSERERVADIEIRIFFRIWAFNNTIAISRLLKWN